MKASLPGFQTEILKESKMNLDNLWKLLISPQKPSAGIPLKKGRIASLDILRGMAVIVMILVHGFGLAGDSQTQQSIFYKMITDVAPPAAPVFMIIMGIFIVLSHKQSLKQKLFRGITLCGLGFTVNILRAALPLQIAISLGMVKDPGQLPMTPLQFLFFTDILIFAGLSYIILSILIVYIKRPLLWIMMILAVIFISPHLWGWKTNIPALNIMINMLWGAEKHIYFPLFPWIIYPMTGLVFGIFIKNAPDFSQLILPSFILGLCLFLPGIIVTYTDRAYQIGEYQRMRFGGHFYCLGSFFVWHTALWVLAEKLFKKWTFPVLNYFSRNTLPAYMIHWILVSWGGFFTGFNTLDQTGTLVFSAAVILTTVGLIQLGNLISRLITDIRRTFAG